MRQAAAIQMNRMPALILHSILNHSGILPVDHENGLLDTHAFHNEGERRKRIQPKFFRSNSRADGSRPHIGWMKIEKPLPSMMAVSSI